MEITASIAKDIASTLLDIQAIKLSPEFYYFIIFKASHSFWEINIDKILLK